MIVHYDSDGKIIKRYICESQLRGSLEMVRKLKSYCANVERELEEILKVAGENESAH